MSEAPENWSHLHPATLAIKALEQLPQLVFGLPAAAYFIGDTSIFVAAIIALIGLLASMLFAYIYWRRFTYWVGEEQLVIQSGVLNRNRRTIPFDRIQDISLEQKLLARIFGVSIARIETGGGGGDEGELNCISRAEADRLRDTIRVYRSGVTAAASDGEVEEEEAISPPIFTMGIGQLLIAGLFNFSLVFLAVIAGSTQYFGSYIPSGYFDPGDMVDSYGKQAVGMVSTYSILTIAMLLLAVGVITGLARTIAREFGFRLSRTETGLRRERGLFTRTDVVIPLKRVQAGIISTGIVKRLFGWRALAVQSLGSDGAAGTHHVVAPLGQQDDLDPILDELSMPAPPPVEAFERVSKRMIWRSWIEDGIALALITAIASIFWSPAPLILLLAIPLAIIPVLQYRAHGYCIDDGLLFVRRGFWRPRVTILPLIKVQSGTLRQNIVQRLLGSATLAIGTAGASLATPLRIADLDQGVARSLLGMRIISR